jgi:hypothetical protein
VRRGDWKYQKVEDREFQFDIACDPRERDDLTRKHPERLAELHGDAADPGQHHPTADEP